MCHGSSGPVLTANQLHIDLTEKEIHEDAEHTLQMSSPHSQDVKEWRRCSRSMNWVQESRNNLNFLSWKYPFVLFCWKSRQLFFVILFWSLILFYSDWIKS